MTDQTQAAAYTASSELNYLVSKQRIVDIVDFHLSELHGVLKVTKGNLTDEQESGYRWAISIIQLIKHDISKVDH